MSKPQAVIFIIVALCSSISILAASDAQLPFAKLLFVDEFDKGMLEPEWEWIDPGNDSTKTFGAREDWLEISTISGNDLWPKANLDAPRLLRSISGDFAVETRLAPSPDRIPQAGGILVWKDEENFIRFDRGTWGYDTILLQKREGGLFQHLGDWFFRGDPVYLRLERRGEKIEALYGSDGERWNQGSQFAFRVDGPMKVGLHAVCLGSRIPYTATDFDYFKIFWAGENQPYTAPNVGRLKDEELQILQKTEDEKLTERASYVLSKTASERVDDSKDVITDPKTGLKFTKIYSDEKLNLLSHNLGLIVSPDGRFLFDHHRHWAIPLKEGEEPFNLAPDIVEVVYGSWSPDMSRFAFIPSQVRDLFVVPISPETGRPTGPAKKLVQSTRNEDVKGGFLPSWSPDGERIAFPWLKGEDLDIWTISATGDELKQITDDPLWERRPLWSPDGKSIIFARKRNPIPEDRIWDAWVIPAEGGTAEKILDEAYLYGFSPDGKWLAFYRVGVNGVDVLRLSDNRQFNITPPEEVVGEFSYGPKVTWSSKGNRLLFYNSGFEYWSTIGLVLPYGGAPVELGKGTRFGSWTQGWSPDGKFILTLDWNTNDLWIVPTDGGTPVKLEVDTEPKIWRYAIQPFSPDLKKLTFITEDMSLWVLPISVEERRVTGPPVKIIEKIRYNTADVGWSPDSKKIVFSSKKSGNADVWIASADGKQLKRLTDEPEDDVISGWRYGSAWSPDGKMIVYAKAEALWVVSASGGEPREIVKDATEPVWSADSKQLGFIKRDDSAISIVTLETGDVRDIVDLEALGMGDPQEPSNHSWGLTWSPDGKWLSFFTVKRRIDHFWVVPAEGGEPRELASSHPGKWWQFWSPDSTRLSYNSDRDVRVRMGAIWEVDVDELLSKE